MREKKRKSNHHRTFGLLLSSIMDITVLLDDCECIQNEKRKFSPMYLGFHRGLKTENFAKAFVELGLS